MGRGVGAGLGVGMRLFIGPDVGRGRPTPGEPCLAEAPRDNFAEAGNVVGVTTRGEWKDWPAWA